MDNLWDSIKEKGATAWVRLSSNWQSFSERMHHKHRLVVMDTDDFKEKFSMELTGVNLFSAVGISVIALIALTSLIIAFTPLRNIIPGYIKPEQREEIVRSAQTIDSLQTVIENHDQLISTIQDVLNGKQLTAKQTEQVKKLEEEAVVYKRSKADSLLRLDVEARHQAEKEATKHSKSKKK